MKRIIVLRVLVAALFLAVLPLRSLAQVSFDVGISVGEPPPPIPVYDQPVVPGPGYVWMPGYWAWGPGGYYWVPGTWVLAPDPGLYWTPGYWAWNGDAYAWDPGYWAAAVGYYGGVDYGGGYYGNGYVGGRWVRNVFEYNTYVTPVPAGFAYAYSDPHVRVIRGGGPRVSYVGGRGGLRTRPTGAQLAIARGRHFGMTSLQRQHVQVAAGDRNLLANVNHGRPGNAAVSRPYSSFRQPSGFSPLTARDRSLAQAHGAVRHGATPQRAAAARGHAAPAGRTAAAAQHRAAPAARAASARTHAAPQHAAYQHRAAAPVHHAAYSTEHRASIQHAYSAPRSAPAARSYSAPRAAPAQHAYSMPHSAPMQHAAYGGGGGRPAMSRPAAAPRAMPAGGRGGGGPAPHPGGGGDEHRH